MKKVFIVVFALALLALIATPIYLLLRFNHVPLNHVGIACDTSTGEITLQERPGWHWTSVSVQVVDIDLTPRTLAIPSSAKVINQKIVRFRKEGAAEFIRLQGFNADLNANMNNILLGYAFSGQQWPFLEVLQEGNAPGMTYEAYTRFLQSSKSNSVSMSP